MSRLGELLRKSANRRRINLNTNVIEDLRLLLFSLEEAHIGIDMNLLVYRKPTKVYRSYSALQAWVDTAAMALPGDFTSLYG